MKQRLFIAIDLPEEFKEKIDKLNKEIIAGRLLHNYYPRFVPPNNLHLTLLFLGYVEEKLIAPINKAIEKVAADFSTFKLETDKILLAPPKGPYRMLWILFKNSTQYNLLQKNLKKTVLDTFSFHNQKLHLNLPSERLTHITLARLKHIINKSEAEQIILPTLDVREMKVVNITLYKSILKSSGAEYEVLFKFQFRINDH